MCAGLRLFVGGEALDRALARRLRAEVRELWNFYGPSRVRQASTIDFTRVGVIRTAP